MFPFYYPPIYVCPQPHMYPSISWREYRRPLPEIRDHFEEIESTATVRLLPVIHTPPETPISINLTLPESRGCECGCSRNGNGNGNGNGNSNGNGQNGTGHNGNGSGHHNGNGNEHGNDRSNGHGGGLFDDDAHAVPRMSIQDHAHDARSAHREEILARRVTFAPMAPSMIPDEAYLSSEDIRQMYISFLDLIHTRINLYIFDWVDLDGTPNDKWNMCYEFTLKMMKRSHSHSYLSHSTCLRILEAAIRLARSELEKGSAWVQLDGKSRERSRNMAYEFLFRLCEGSGLSPNIVYVHASRARAGMRRRSVIPRGVDGQPVWD